jgi:hypothetical protein
MERLIVNEGQGPVSRELTAPLMHVGGDERCDLVLRHPSTLGNVFSIERTTHGHCARGLKGVVFHNEVVLAAADLLHNDTLRAGDTLVLYKNPLATLPAAGHAQAVVLEHLPPLTFEEVAVIEELEILDELEPLDERTGSGDDREQPASGPVTSTQEPLLPGLANFETPRSGAAPSGQSGDIRESRDQGGANARGAQSGDGGMPSSAPRPSADDVRFRKPQAPGRHGSTFLPPKHRGRPSR